MSEHQRKRDIKGATISKQLKPQQMRKVIGMGMWNKRTMRTIGKVETVESEMRRMRIGCLGLAEMQWSGKGDFVTDVGSTMIYSGTDSRMSQVWQWSLTRSGRDHSWVTTSKQSHTDSAFSRASMEFDPYPGLRANKPSWWSREGQLLHLLTAGVPTGTKAGHRPVERGFQRKDRHRGTDRIACIGFSKKERRKTSSIRASEWSSCNECNGSATRQTNVHMEIAWRSSPQPNWLLSGTKEMVDQCPKVQIISWSRYRQWPHTGWHEVWDKAAQVTEKDSM